MKCHNCNADLPEGARRCVRCEAAIDEIPLDEETMREVLGGLDPDVLDHLTELAASCEDGESFADALFVGDCPQCGSEDVGTYMEVVDVEDPTVARCFACGHHWCTECGERIDWPKRSCGHWAVCEKCGKEEDCGYLGDVTECPLIQEWLSRNPK